MFIQAMAAAGAMDGRGKLPIYQKEHKPVCRSTVFQLRTICNSRPCGTETSLITPPLKAKKPEKEPDRAYVGTPSSE